MMRVAVLTDDPALQQRLARAAQGLDATFIDLRLAGSRAALAQAQAGCEALVLDARAAQDGAAAHPLQTPWGVPALALVDHGHTPLLAAFLGQSPLHEVAFLPNGAAAVREAVRSFLQRRKASAGPTVMRWGAYCFDPLQSTVGLEGAAPVPLSRHKFRFALSLFLHQGVELSWADLHRMAWGHDRPARRASVAAHATWAGETLRLDGSLGYRLDATPATYCLRHAPASG